MYHSCVVHVSFMYHSCADHVCRLCGAGFGLRVASYQLQVMGCGLRVTSCRLWVASYQLHVASCWICCLVVRIWVVIPSIISNWLVSCAFLVWFMYYWCTIHVPSLCWAFVVVCGSYFTHFMKNKVIEVIGAKYILIDSAFSFTSHSISSASPY